MIQSHVLFNIYDVISFTCLLIEVGPISVYCAALVICHVTGPIVSQRRHRVN